MLMLLKRRNSSAVWAVCSCIVALILDDASFSARAFVPSDVRQRWVDTGYKADDAIALIEQCAQTGQSPQPDPKELFWAVKFLDRFANDIYGDLETRKSLLDRTNGSWELRLACNTDRDEEFYPHPEFRSFATAFSTVQDDYFGKGISTKDKAFCFVALAGPSTRIPKRRQVFMNYEDYFINGNQVPGWDLSYYLRGFQRNSNAAERDRPVLAFTVICATDTALAVRGSKTGGLAIFRRIEDMSGIAFGA
mmetsp:Transcript_7318/g.12750  ORF Transcript_7318/g.12750 Transcript_7318/m.12750 type:complete len:250 (-) Transcript_7318:1904-2653(-)|eukprot:CAMPEP_0178885048 /NCGR_PEP_ID=MMETSP0747-20121128/15130_1 /TAXON_ID=913974 /ORGANISM="Nitzschia punctata, Strain CCMP561" /LENGTH=249 /DNA_ID=CAMNT_0020553665 /DNA_START=175 /DNA_END=924 /DNA_ORIENTATION=+